MLKSSYITYNFHSLTGGSLYEPIGTLNETGTASYVEKNQHHYLKISDNDVPDIEINIKDADLDYQSENSNNYQIVIKISNKKYGFNFDQNSAAAAKKFRDDFIKYKNTHQKTIYYNGTSNIKYWGDVLNGTPNGSGIMYYNSNRNDIMCEGKFLDGKYNGVCKFYSPYGHVQLIANNMSNGKFCDYGKLIFKNTVYEIDFDDNDYAHIISRSLDINTQTSICVDLANIVIPEFQNNHEQACFNSYSYDEKINYMMRKMNNLELENTKLKSRIDTLEKTVTNPISLMSSMATPLFSRK